MLRAIVRWLFGSEPPTEVSVSKSVKVNTPEGNNIYDDNSNFTVTTNAETAERLMSEQSRTNLDTMREGLRGVRDIQSNQMLMANPRQQDRVTVFTESLLATVHKILLNVVWNPLTTGCIWLWDKFITYMPLATVYKILLNVVWNPLATGCLLLWDKFIAYIDIEEKPVIEHFSTERTVTVHTQGGGKIVAHKKEVVKKDNLVEAVHFISQHAPACSTEGGVKIWRREYHDSSDNSNTGFSMNN